MTQYKPTINLMVFPNDKKEKETSPDYSINIKLNDKFEKAGAGWKKTSPKTGNKYLSLSVDIDMLKELIMEKISTLNSDGSEQPNFEPKKDDKEFDNF